MSGLCLLQEMTEGLGSYPNASVWRPEPSTLEALDADLLVEIRQNQSELWSSQSPLFFPDFRHSGSTEPSQELCFSHLPSAAWGLLEQSSLQPTTASLSSPNFAHFPLLNCLAFGFFSPHVWLTSAFYTLWIRMKHTGYNFSSSLLWLFHCSFAFFSLLYLLKLLYHLESARACPPHTLICAFTVLSHLLASPFLPVPSFRPSLMQEPASQSWFLKVLSSSNPLLIQIC